MKISFVRVSNFQSFGPEPLTLCLNEISYLIGSNASGKTAFLEALCRMFAFHGALRKVKSSDFHIPSTEEKEPTERNLWIEAEFVFPELLEESDNNTVPPHFAHMRLDSKGSIPRVRFRLSASMDIDGEIEQDFSYVLDIDEDGTPRTSRPVRRDERHYIQLHYLPARRDPSDHISSSATTLLGKLIRSISWESERGEVAQLTNSIGIKLESNPTVKVFSAGLTKLWSKLHKGDYFAEPSLTFSSSDINELLRHMSVTFSVTIHPLPMLQVCVVRQRLESGS